MDTPETTTSSHSAELQALFDELHHEVGTLAKVTRDGGKESWPDPVALNQIERRTLTKSVFSFVEAMTFGMKSSALKADATVRRLSRAEQAVAAEEAYELNEQGMAIVKSARLRTLSNVRFAFRVFAKVDEASFELDVSGTGWQATQRALRIRDRLMHPKKASDLIVEDEEVRDVLNAFIWFSRQMIRLFLAALDALRAERDRFDQMKTAIVEYRGQQALAEK
jgi:hypothetical protein